MHNLKKSARDITLYNRHNTKRLRVDRAFTVADIYMYIKQVNTG